MYLQVNRREIFREVIPIEYELFHLICGVEELSGNLTMQEFFFRFIQQNANIYTRKNFQMELSACENNSLNVFL